MRNSNWMTRALALAVVALAMVAVPARAQTPEGTTITNKARVTYQDANNRLYAPDSASVTVTVGFAAGLDVPDVAGVAPASPSTAQLITFTVNNIGNGTDTVQVSGEVISNPAVMTVTGYQINGAGPFYADTAALNVQLLTLSLTGITGSLTITVRYDVPDGQGGVSTNYTLTARSVRDITETDPGTTSISPPTAFSVAVTPDGGTVQQLPSGPTYTQNFTVQNTGNVSEAFDLIASNQALGVITIVTVNGVAGDSTQVVIASGASPTIAVTYTVAEVALGSTERLTLLARSVAQPATLDDGYVDIEVIRPRVTIAKQVYRSDQSTVILPTDRVLPQEVIWYLVTVTNAGNQDAETVQVADTLPGQLTFESYAGDVPAEWGLSNVGNAVTANLTVTLAPAASRFFWIEARVN